MPKIAAIFRSHSSVRMEVRFLARLVNVIATALLVGQEISVKRQFPNLVLPGHKDKLA